MLQILLKQPLHLWKSQNLWARIQIVFLVAIIYFYATERLLVLSSFWLNRISLSAFFLADLGLHLFVVINFLNGIFIFTRLFPAQHLLNSFRSLPLDQKELALLLGFYYHKYQILPFLFFLPLLFTLILLHPGAGFSSLFLLIFYDVAFFILLLRWFSRKRSHREFLLLSFGFIAAYLSSGLLVYWLTNHFFYLDLLVFLLLPLLMRFVFPAPCDSDLNRLFPPAGKSYSQDKLFQRFLTFILKPLPKFLRPFFVKDFLGLWRNRAYRRLKFFTFGAYFLAQAVLFFSPIKNKEMWMILLGMAVIWWHYAQHFNDKYVQADPEWFFRGLPLRFSHLWLPRFGTELFFVFLLLCGQVAFLETVGYGSTEMAHWLGLLALFAVLVLVVVIDFQIYFYDDPRLGGYAYHFTVIFFGVMSVNYRLVGPLVTIAFLIYFTTKTYRFFKS